MTTNVCIKRYYCTFEKMLDKKSHKLPSDVGRNSPPCYLYSLPSYPCTGKNNVSSSLLMQKKMKNLSPKIKQTTQNMKMATNRQLSVSYGEVQLTCCQKNEVLHQRASHHQRRNHHHPRGRPQSWSDHLAGWHWKGVVCSVRGEHSSPSSSDFLLPQNWWLAHPMGKKQYIQKTGKFMRGVMEGGGQSSSFFPLHKSC